MSTTKSITVKVLLFSVLLRLLSPRIWPWGFAQPWLDRPKYSSVDTTNDSLMVKHGRLKKIYERMEPGKERLLKGPETIVFGNDGTMYAQTEDGYLVTLTDFIDQEDGVSITAKVSIVADLGVGRPLGGKFSKDNILYIADAHLGLTRLKNPGLSSTSNNNDTSRTTKVELVASRVFDQGTWTQILYANDVTVGPKTGRVYFTDSSEIAPDRIGTRSWDTMYAAKTDLIRGRKTGRLLQYDPKTDNVTVLARNLHFANGIAVDSNENFVYISETFTLQMLKYSLSEGTITAVMNDNDNNDNSNNSRGRLTGFPDGLDCAWKGITAKESNSCYMVMPSAMTPLMIGVMKLPHPIDMLARSLLIGLHKSLAPPLKPYGGIVEINPESGDIFRLIQDPTGKDIKALAGITVFDNKLYLGSLHNEYIGVYEL